MTLEQVNVYINAQATSMLAEMNGMVAENNQRIYRGESMAFVYDDFIKLPEKYGLTHNQVLTEFQCV